jgi:hypothetical protein
MNEAQTAVSGPDLTGRTARCTYYGKRKALGSYSSSSCDAGRDAPICNCTRPSSTDLAFFKFCGGGTPAAFICRHCRYSLVAHADGRCPQGGSRRPRSTRYEPQGAQEFDEFYCGCHGWD